MHTTRHHITALFLAATAALAVSVACGRTGDEDPVPTAPEEAVTFGASVSGTRLTRASVTDLNQLKETGFGVFAYTTGNDDFNPDAGAGLTPDFMCNQKVWWVPGSSGSSGVGKWQYAPERSWPGQKVSFLAYAPYSDGSGATGITGTADSGTPGSPFVEFKADSDVDGQIDLVYADADSTSNMTGGMQVKFHFRHALARIGFRCAATETLDKNSVIIIDSIILRAAGAGVSGRLDLYSGKWDRTVAGDMTYRLGKDDFKRFSNIINSGKGTEESDMSAAGKYLMVMPSPDPVDMDVTVKFDIDTTDPNLPSGSVVTRNSITGKFRQSFEAGKAYSLTLRIGVHSMDIGAGLTDWEEYETGWTSPVE